ncbi:hypothetical protein [Methylobacterium fujisawaense]|uniref:hypothetical protein n=1 Tax=Methylobacterium fujisawaense TaxID=107400 RepID=UPI00313EC24E
MKRIFGRSEIEAWERALRTNLPQPITDEEVPGMPEVESVLAIVMTVGIGFRMKTRGGDEIDVMLNPVVARAMAAGVLKHGQEEGWLNERGEVISPPLPRDH